MNQRLIFKLLAIHIVVIAFTMAIMWLVIDTLAAGYFVTLMEKYHISPEPAHEMFVNAVHRYLIWACLAALILAVVLSFFMMRRVLAPLIRMTQITQEIAAGNFSAHVPTGTRDEIGRLAQAFNRMAESLKKLESLRRSLMIDVANGLAYAATQGVTHRDMKLSNVLVTSQGSEEIAVEALKSGAASYSPKSDLSRDLIVTVNRVTGRSDRA